MRQKTRRLSGALAGFVVLLVGCGGDGGPTGPDRSSLEIRVVSGDGQFALAGQTLPDLLVVQVRDRIDLSPESGLQVAWAVSQGAGATLSRESTVTDAQGMASVSLTLGPSEGDYGVTATFDGLTDSPASFQAQAVGMPTITDLPATPVQAGQVIAIGGQGFSSTAADNLVLFSGIRGQVESASANELQVQVPACLPTRTVQVTAGFGEVQSQGMPLDVEASGAPLNLEVGEDRTITVSEGLECLKLQAGTRWTAVVQSAAEVDGSTFGYELTGLLGGGASAAALASPFGRSAVSGASVGDGEDRPALPMGDAQARWEGVVRGLERELPPVQAREREAWARVSAPAEVPQVGDRRDFKVLNADRDFDQITAEVVYVGQHAVMYRDLDAPQNGLTAGEFEAMAHDFDDFTYPTDTGVFGAVSDLDGNQRVVILFTPVVNKLTDPGSEGFVAGFFYGLDLLPDRDNSNGGEVFYALVPDPDGQYGDARSRDLILRVLPGVLAHEFQHMINFNQRVLIRDGDFSDVLWVSEGMAVMAEDLVGEAFAEAGDADKADLYQAGNWARAQRYLRDPSAASLVATQGQGSLEERGSWWLFFRYLRGQRGDNSVLTQLTQTTRTGVTNVEAVTGQAWPSLVSDWSAAIVLDDQSVPVPDRLQFTDLALRATINRLQDGWPLSPPIIGGADFQRVGSAVASSQAYFELRPGTASGVDAMALNLAGPNGGAPQTGASLQLTLVRIQ